MTNQKWVLFSESKPENNRFITVIWADGVETEQMWNDRMRLNKDGETIFDGVTVKPVFWLYE